MSSQTRILFEQKRKKILLKNDTKIYVNLNQITWIKKSSIVGVDSFCYSFVILLK